MRKETILSALMSKELGANDLVTVGVKVGGKVVGVIEGEREDASMLPRKNVSVELGTGVGDTEAFIVGTEDIEGIKDPTILGTADVEGTSDSLALGEGEIEGTPEVVGY